MEGLGRRWHDFYAVGKSMDSLIPFLPAWTLSGSHHIGRLVGSIELLWGLCAEGMVGL